jgi:FAD/FMN-containing dehydrogenase
VKKSISNWGNYPTREVEWIEALQFNDADLIKRIEGNAIARGLGRCYGDSALSNTVISTLKLNKFIAFNPETGVLECESGVSFEDILNIFVPRGFFLPVTPGTKFITVGGAIASDIHGKNHHCEGTFSSHVMRISLMLASGEIVHCSPSENSELFYATCGGMGLTGIILSAVFKLKKIKTSFIQQQTIICKNLDEIIEAFETHETATYSVAWIDCMIRGKNLGRSVLMPGEHQIEANKAENGLTLHKKSKLNIPFYFPSLALNPLSVKAFNFLYYNKAKLSGKTSVVHYEPYFYPLDAVLNWNRIYGSRGFTQYQFVIPKEVGKEGLPKILKKITESGLGSFLAVLKLFGKQKPHNPILFPMEGYTLALDFPISPKLFPLLDELDAMVADYGGRVYLTKDVRLRPEMFRKMYPDAERFIETIRKFNPEFVFSSQQSERLKIHG